MIENLVRIDRARRRVFVREWYVLRDKPAEELGDLKTLPTIEVCRSGYASPVFQIVRLGDEWACYSVDGTLRGADPFLIAARVLL